ncbi:MAG TPA: hypothetical protein VGT02_10030, partial [Methylomirabilota bacterium]|nr:hypothetical protein [Methylomirabilota bacterium]
MIERSMVQFAALDGHGGRRDERDPYPCCHQTQDLLRMFGLVSDPHGETHVAAERHDEIVIRGCPLTGEENLWLVGKRVSGDARERLQPVAFGKGDDQGLGEDRFDNEVLLVH